MAKQLNCIKQSDMWKLGQWLEAKELTVDDTREGLAAEAATMIGAPVTVNNITSLLDMVGKKLPSIRTMDTDQRVRILARNIRAIMLHLNIPVSTELEHLC